MLTLPQQQAIAQQLQQQQLSQMVQSNASGLGTQPKPLPSTSSLPIQSQSAPISQLQQQQKSLQQLLSKTKAEVAVLIQNNEQLKKKKEEYEGQLHSLNSELIRFSQAIDTLDAQFRRTKSNYENEVMRLKADVEFLLAKKRDINNPQSAEAGTNESLMNVPAVETEKPPQNGNEISPDNDSPNFDSSEDKPNGDWVVCPMQSDNVCIELKHTFEHDSVVCSTAFNKDGTLFATGSDKFAQIFSVETGAKKISIPVQGDTIIECSNESTTLNHSLSSSNSQLFVRSVCFSPLGHIFATGADNATVKLWDLTRRCVISTLLGHGLDIYSLAFSPDGETLISGADDKQVRLWDIIRGECVFTFSDANGTEDGVTSVDVSNDGKLLAVGSLDRTVHLYNLKDRKRIKILSGHSASVYSVAFSPDNKQLASGSLDKTIRIWDLKSLTTQTTLDSHKDYVLSLCYSPQGYRLATASKDRSVLLWDSENDYTPLAMLSGHRNSVISVSMAGHNLLGTGSGDRRARIWTYGEKTKPSNTEAIVNSL